MWGEAARRAPKKVRPGIFLSRPAGTESALRILDNAHALAPGDPRPLIEKGRRLLEIKLPDLAAQEFEHALELAPDDATALNNYGAALSLLGKRDLAVEQFRHALRVDPCSATPRKNLALLGVTGVAGCK